MLITHVYLNGTCREAIDLYVKAFNAKINIIIPSTDNDNLIVHSEIYIHDEMLMLNDFGNNEGPSKSGGYQLSVRFDNLEDLKGTYSFFKDDSAIITPMQATDYSVCVVRFIDKYDVRWAFWV